MKLQNGMQFIFGRNGSTIFTINKINYDKDTCVVSWISSRHLNNDQISSIYTILDVTDYINNKVWTIIKCNKKLYKKVLDI